MKPSRMCLGYCRCCGAVVRASRMIDTDECSDCFVWSVRLSGGIR
jgi:hypothetical protein